MSLVHIDTEILTLTSPLTTHKLLSIDTLINITEVVPRLRLLDRTVGLGSLAQTSGEVVGVPIEGPSTGPTGESRTRRDEERRFDVRRDSSNHDKEVDTDMVLLPTDTTSGTWGKCLLGGRRDLQESLATTPCYVRHLGPCLLLPGDDLGHPSLVRVLWIDHDLFTNDGALGGSLLEGPGPPSHLYHRYLLPSLRRRTSRRNRSFGSGLPRRRRSKLM